MPKVFLSPEDRASNAYAAEARWNGKVTNEKEQMGRCADFLEIALKRCGCEVINAQYGNMYDRVKASNDWPADLHIALHTNGFDGTVAGTRVHCYPSEKSRQIGKLIQDRIAPMSPGTSERLVEDTRLYELRAPHMPAVLPEFGFHDNVQEAQWLIDNMEAIAEETCKAVCEFFNIVYVAPDKTVTLPSAPVEEAPAVSQLWRVQVGAFAKKKNAEDLLQKLKEAGFEGVLVSQAAQETIAVGSKVRVKNGAKTYTGGDLAPFVYARDHIVRTLAGKRAVITYGGVVVAAVNVDDLTLAL